MRAAGTRRSEKSEGWRGRDAAVGLEVGWSGGTEVGWSGGSDGANTPATRAGSSGTAASKHRPGSSAACLQRRVCAEGGGLRAQVRAPPAVGGSERSDCASSFGVAALARFCGESGSDWTTTDGAGKTGFRGGGYVAAAVRTYLRYAGESRDRRLELIRQR